MRGTHRVSNVVKGVVPCELILSPDQLEALRARQRKRWGIIRIYTDGDSYKGFQADARKCSLDVTDEDVPHDVCFDSVLITSLSFFF